MRGFGTRTAGLSLVLLGAACGSEGTSSAWGDEESSVESNQPNQEAQVAEFGGASRRFVTVAAGPQGLNGPRDLAFNPERPNELWIVNRAFDGTVTLVNPGTPEQRIDKRADVYGSHFMEEVSSISFGANSTFGTCQESRNTYNNQAPPNDFMGPTLWSSDMSIYARVNQNNALLGSHLDMLHASPYCMGMEHDRDNIYWVVDGKNGHVVYYDFKRDHGPGYDDHSDGVIRRYVNATVTRKPDVPSHMALDKASGWLYVADTGGRRVIRLDTRTGRKAGNLSWINEPLAEYSRYTDATVEVFANTNLSEPSGVALQNTTLFVSDHGSQEIIAYDIESGRELSRIATTARGIMGIAIGPDNRLWYVDNAANAVVRIDP